MAFYPQTVPVRYLLRDEPLKEPEVEVVEGENESVSFAEAYRGFKIFSSFLKNADYVTGSLKLKMNFWLRVILRGGKLLLPSTLSPLMDPLLQVRRQLRKRPKQHKFLQCYQSRNNMRVVAFASYRPAKPTHALYAIDLCM